VTLTDAKALAEIALPILTAVALAGTALVTWLLAGARARHLARVVRRQDRTIAALEGRLTAAETDLAAEQTLVARLTAPAADLIADVRGAHHRQEESRG
jgi:hypothetical protein